MGGVLFRLPCSLIFVAVHGIQVLHKVQCILCCLGVCRSSPLHPAGHILVRHVCEGLLSCGCTDGFHPCIQGVHGVDIHVHLRLPPLVFKADHFAFLRSGETGRLRCTCRYTVRAALFRIRFHGSVLLIVLGLRIAFYFVPINAH